MLRRFVQVYCYDILIFSKTQHLVHVCMVLETLLHHKLLQARRCRAAVDPHKVAAVAK